MKAPTKKPEPKKTERLLQVKLTTDDRLRYGAEMAEVKEMKDRLEQQASEVSKDFKAKIATQDTRMGSLSSVLRCGYEYKTIECLIHLDMPKKGQKSTVRQDTGEIVETLDMTDSDKQAVMEFAEEE